MGFTLLYFADTVFFTNWRSVATLHLTSLSLSFFSNSIAVYIKFWRFLNYFKHFHYYYICYLCSVISDIIIVTTLGCHKSCPCKTANLTDKWACSDYVFCSINWLLPPLFNYDKEKNEIIAHTLLIRPRAWLAHQKAKRVFPQENR